SQLKTGHPVRSAIHKQLNGRLVLRWVTTWESLLLYVLHFCLFFLWLYPPTYSSLGALVAYRKQVCCRLLWQRICKA
ncbi:hypothetical protein KCU77_g11017, partial [Aureobasidium melanogenum]